VLENEEIKRKASVYIDGFNLYFALKERNWQRFMWLDLVKLSETLIRPDQDLVLVKYFTSRIKNNPGKQKRQNAYLDALETLKKLEIYYGNYQDFPIGCNGCGRRWPDRQEKQTDVNIATHMLMDSFRDGYIDDIILITADSDQCPAMTAVRSLGKEVLAVLPPGRADYLEVPFAANRSLELTAKKFQTSLLPERVTSKSGFVIVRPDDYK
jgi:uncharacterized LabA/DUF88 family protein